MAEDYKARIAKVNELLLANEPRNITVDEHSGYSGYKPQYIIDSLNEVFELGEWGFEEISNHIEPGDKGGMAIAQVQVWLKGIDFKPTGWGQNRVTRGDTGDALKAAQTDAIKKALSYYSIGNRAYLGLLPKDKSSNQQQRPNVNAQRPQPAQQPRPMIAPVSVPQAQQTAQPAQAVSTPVSLSTPTVKELQARCKELFGAGQWAATKVKVIGGNIADDNMTPEQQTQMHQAFEKVAAKRAIEAA